MNLVLWIIFAVISLAATVFLGLREFHMLQLNGYKTPEHSWWMKKNKKRYILPAALFCAQFLLIPLQNKSGAATAIIIVLCFFNAIIALLNKPGKKFKKPLVYTARMKRMMITFGILVAICYTIAILNGKTFAQVDTIDGGYEETNWFISALPYIMAGSALYLTPILVPLSNLINKPVEKAVQNWYINDAKRMLSECPTLHKVGITGSYGKTSMKFYLDELLNSQYNTLKAAI